MTLRVDYDDGRAEELLNELTKVDSADARREEILSELVEIHAPYARHLAHRYARRGESVEDIEQAAMLGLVKAINRFDPEIGQRFLPYAAPTMMGEVKRHFRDRTWAMRMPRRLQELRLALNAARQDFVTEHGRSATVPEISEILGISEDEVIEALGAADAYRPVSLDVPVAEDAESGETLGDFVGDEDPELESVVDRTALRPLLDGLPDRERMILLYRFFGNKTQAEIAELMNLSQMHISRLISRTLARLRTELLQDA